MWWNPYFEVSPRNANLLKAGAILSALAIWAVLSYIINPPGTPGMAKLPAPWDVLHAYYILFETGSLFPAIWASLLRVIAATVLVVAIGVPIGFFMGGSPRINAVLSPLIDPFRSAPIVAILPILVLWLGIGEVLKVSFLTLGAVVYLIPMVRDAIKAVPRSYWTSAYDLGATEFEALLKAVLPMALPRIADAAIVAVSIQWTYITVAEYVNSDSGMGRLIELGKRNSSMEQVFAVIILIIALALVTHTLLSYLRNRTFHWEGQ